MFKFIVKRSKWLRGKEAHEYGSSLLQSGVEKMCCLGFLARECGYTRNEIRDKRFPYNVDKHDKFIPGLINKQGANSRTCIAIVNTNDSKTMKDSTREARLKKFFRKIKVGVKFVD